MVTVRERRFGRRASALARLIHWWEESLRAAKEEDEDDDGDVQTSCRKRRVKFSVKRAGWVER